MDKSILNDVIVGRVEPHIYAFTTETVPNYLKVGDTYRPAVVRLNEWRTYYPNLIKRYEHVAKTKNEKYYRDFAVHYYLENIKQFHRLQKGELKDIPYFVHTHIISYLMLKRIRKSFMFHSRFHNKSQAFQSIRTGTFQTVRSSRSS